MKRCHHVVFLILTLTSTSPAKVNEMKIILPTCGSGICSKYNPVWSKENVLHVEVQELILSLINIFTTMFVSKQNARNSY